MKRCYGTVEAQGAADPTVINGVRNWFSGYSWFARTGLFFYPAGYGKQYP